MYSEPKEIRRNSTNSSSVDREVVRERLYFPSFYAVVNEEDMFCGECGFKLLIEESKPDLRKKERKTNQTSAETDLEEIKASPNNISTKEELKEYKQLFDEGLIT